MPPLPKAILKLSGDPPQNTRQCPGDGHSSWLGGQGAGTAVFLPPTAPTAHELYPFSSVQGWDLSEAWQFPRAGEEAAVLTSPLLKCLGQAMLDTGAMEEGTGAVEVALGL